MSNRIAKITDKPGLLFTPIPDRIDHVERGLLSFNSPALLFFSQQSTAIYLNAPWVEESRYLGPWHKVTLVNSTNMSFKVHDKDLDWRRRMLIMYHREISLLKSHALINGML